MLKRILALSLLSLSMVLPGCGAPPVEEEPPPAAQAAQAAQATQPAASMQTAARVTQSDGTTAYYCEWKCGTCRMRGGNLMQLCSGCGAPFWALC